jgi:hypothetical protein
MLLSILQYTLNILLKGFGGMNIGIFQIVTKNKDKMKINQF